MNITTIFLFAILVITSNITYSAGLDLADQPLFSTGVLKPNVIITTPYEEPHNELFIQYLNNTWLANNGSNPDTTVTLDSYFSEYGDAKRGTGFLRNGTYYERFGLTLPWPASNASTCDGYKSSTVEGYEQCIPIDVYQDGLSERVRGALSPSKTTLTESEQRLRYVLASPEKNTPAPPDSGTNATCTTTNLACFYTADRMTRSKMNLLYFQHDAYDKYTPWPNSATYTFNNMTMSSADHNPVYHELGGRDLYSVTGFGLVPNKTNGPTEDFLFNFEPLDVNKSSNTTGSTEYTNLYKPISDTGKFFWQSKYYTIGQGSPLSSFTYGQLGQNFANWYTYYRSSSLMSKAIVGRVLKGLVERGTNERFRIGYTKSNIDLSNNNTIKSNINDIITHPRTGTESWINSLLDTVYTTKGAVGFYNPSTGVDYATQFFTEDLPYRSNTDSDAPSTDNTSNPMYGCRRNFEILVFPDISTVYWGTKLGTTYGTGTMASTLSTLYGNADNCSETFTSGTANGSAYCKQKDSYSGTFADMALVGWKNDLKPGLSNLILPTIRNPATWQNVVRYVIAPGGYMENGVIIDKYGNVTHDNNIDATNTWPNPGYIGINTLSAGSYNSEYNPNYMTYDDLYHMALNSRGHFSAYGNITAAVEKVTEALLDILVRNSTGSAVATNTTAIATSGTIYQAALDGDWRGRLRAYKISVSGGTSSIDPSPLWDAAYMVSAQSKVDKITSSYYDNRRIFTVDNNAATPAPTTLRWDNLSASLKTTLASPGAPFNTVTVLHNGAANSSYTDKSSDTHEIYYGKQMLNYLRGNGACEQNTTCDTYQNNGSPLEELSTQFRKRGLEIFSSTNDSSRQALSATSSDGRNTLGDITNSSPWYIGSTLPGLSDVDYPGYNAYRKTKATRTGVVYVGANDGMLHAFHAPNCTTTSACTTAKAGQELFAYIPSFVFDNLTLLANTGYDHKYYVDGSPFAAESYVGGAWKTVLIGGVNKGGKGYYALDVSCLGTNSTDDPSCATNPAPTFTATSANLADEANITNTFMWEFSNATARTSDGLTVDSGMGYTYNVPTINRNTGQARQIVRTRAGTGCATTSANGKKNCKWAVIVGNGYSESAGAQAALYVLFLDGPDSSTKLWTEGTHYRKISVGSTDYSSDGGKDTNGLSSTYPMDIDLDGFVDYVYAGDINGNLWKFDLTSSNPAEWSASYAGNPLFVAKNGSSQRQPIIMPPEVGIHQSSGKPLVLFGTGKLIETNDDTNTEAQSFYAVLDHPKRSGDSYLSLTRSSLKQRISTSPFISSSANTSYRIMSDTSSFTYCTNTSASACTVGNENAANDRYFGWYWDMPDAGERLTGRPQLITGDIRFNTYIPDSDPCAYGGTGWEMCLDAKSGIQSCLDSRVTLDSTSQYGGLSVIGGKKVGAVLGGMSYVPSLDGSYIKIYSPLGSDNEGTVQSDVVSGAGNQGRVSWYELTD